MLSKVVRKFGFVIVVSVIRFSDTVSFTNGVNHSKDLANV